MKIYSILIIISFFLFSCQQIQNRGQRKNSFPAKGQAKAMNVPSKVNFDFSAFTIDKGGIGPIKIGMTLPQAEKHLNGLTKEASEATAFGYGGGSPAYIYSLSGQPLLVLIPKLDTDTTFLIIVVHKDLKTSNGLNPNSTVAELLEKYANLAINQDLMNVWEYATDTGNKWDFVFMTDEKEQVGEYLELEVPSKPKRLEVRTNWITIK